MAAKRRMLRREALQGASGWERDPFIFHELRMPLCMLLGKLQPRTLRLNG
jgi:hypothetical protein